MRERARVTQAEAMAAPSPIDYTGLPRSLRPEIKRLIEALARDAVAREDRRAQERAGKKQAKEK